MPVIRHFLHAMSPIVVLLSVDSPQEVEVFATWLYNGKITLVVENDEQGETGKDQSDSSESEDSSSDTCDDETSKKQTAAPKPLPPTRFGST